MLHRMRMKYREDQEAKKLETSTAPSSSHQEEPRPAEEPPASEVAGVNETAPRSEIPSAENQETTRRRKRSRRKKGKQKAQEVARHDKKKAPKRKKVEQILTPEEEERRLKAREMMASKIGLENPAWAVQKTLYVSDVDGHQHRLQLPRLEVEGSPLLGLMTPAETDMMYGKGARVVVLDGLQNEYSMLFRDVGDNNGFRILGADWMNYVRQNKLQTGDFLDLCAFRRRPSGDEGKTELVFVLLHHRNQKRREESEKKAKEVKAKNASPSSSSSSSSSPPPVQTSSGITAQDEADADLGLRKFLEGYPEIQ